MCIKQAFETPEHQSSSAVNLALHQKLSLEKSCCTGSQSLVHIHADSSQLNSSNQPKAHQQRRLGPGLIGWFILLGISTPWKAGIETLWGDASDILCLKLVNLYDKSQSHALQELDCDTSNSGSGGIPSPTSLKSATCHRKPIQSTWEMALLLYSAYITAWCYLWVHRSCSSVSIICRCWWQSAFWRTVISTSYFHQGKSIAECH